VDDCTGGWRFGYQAGAGLDPVARVPASRFDSRADSSWRTVRGHSRTASRRTHFVPDVLRREGLLRQWWRKTTGAVSEAVAPARSAWPTRRRAQAAARKVREAWGGKNCRRPRVLVGKTHDKRDPGGIAGHAAPHLKSKKEISITSTGCADAVQAGRNARKPPFWKWECRGPGRAGATCGNCAPGCRDRHARSRGALGIFLVGGRDALANARVD